MTSTETALFDILRRIRSAYYDSPRKSATAWQEIAQEMFLIASEALTVGNLPKPVDQLSFEEKLTALRKLERNWDSYSANPIAPEAIDAVSAVEITPTTQSGVQISWKKESTAVEFGASGEVVSIWWEKPRK